MNDTLVNDLVTANIDIVDKVIPYFRKIDNGDAYSEGSFALYKAAVSFAEKANTYEGAKGFRNFAYTAVRNKMVDMVRVTVRQQNIMSLEQFVAPSYNDIDFNAATYECLNEKEPGYELVENVSALRYFLEHECDNVDRVIIITLLRIHASGAKVSQGALLEQMGKRNVSMTQGCLSKRMKKLEKRYVEYAGR
jgi:hypothetical protein